MFTRFFEVSPFAKSKNLVGKSAPFTFWSYYQQYTNNLVSYINSDKLILEGVPKEWDSNYSRIREKLGLDEPIKKTSLSAEVMDSIVGQYSMTGNSSKRLSITKHENRLYMDFAWKNIMLIPVNSSELLLEAWPVRLEFFSENKKIGFNLLGERLHDQHSEMLNHSFIKI